VALIVGVGAGAIVIPVILNLLNKAFGFEGGPAGHRRRPAGGPAGDADLGPRQGCHRRRPALGPDRPGRRDRRRHHHPRRHANKATKGKVKLPPLAVGIGFYLPAAVTTMLVVGAVCGWFYDKAIKTTRNTPTSAAAWACCWPRA
jgi:uncharacterized oligopeptide transporter (OPT) family protein